MATRAAKRAPAIDFEGQLRGKLAERFAEEAAARKQSPAELAAAIIETVINDNLFAAVLDG
jgi:hypothetical protein